MTRDDLKNIPTPDDGSDSQKTVLMATPADSAPTEPGRQPIAVIGAPGSDSPGAADSDEDVEERLAYESLMRHRKARRRKKIIAAGVVGGIVVVAGIVWAVVSHQPSGADAGQQLSTVGVYRSEFSESVQATGTAQPLSSVAVTPEVTGIISEVKVAEGDHVEEGQVLMTIKNDDLDKTVREAEIAVRSAKADLASAQSAYNTAYKEYKNPGSTVTGLGSYSGSGSFHTADETTDGSGDAQTFATVTWSDVEKAQAAVDSAKLALETAQENYNEAVANADKRTIKAPQAGSVVSMKAVAGESVGAGAGTAANGGSGSLITIADLSQMTVKVQVNEVDISKIAVGQPARVSFSALPGTMLDAQVTRISTVSSSDDSGMGYGMGGVVTYDVELLIPEPTAELKPGMTASVEIMQQLVEDALTVPVQALATDDGTSFYVYVMTDPNTQETERRDVTVGAQSDSTAVIESGLNEGDLVVLDPYSVSAGDMSATDGAPADGAVPADGSDSGDGEVVSDSLSTGAGGESSGASEATPAA